VRVSRRSTRRRIAILELDGLRAGGQRYRNTPYPHEVAITYLDGGVPLAWLIANEGSWAESRCCCGQEVGQFPLDAPLFCDGAKSGKGLCPRAAIVTIIEATRSYRVLSSDGLNTTAWLRSLFLAGSAEAFELKVTDLAGWAQRQYGSDAIRNAAQAAGKLTRLEARAASSAAKSATFVRYLHGANKKQPRSPPKRSSAKLDPPSGGV
jgi:hypothetical protein